MEERQGFFMRWVMPVVFVLVVIAAFGLLGRTSIPPLEADAVSPEGHFTSNCTICHRYE